MNTFRHKFSGILLAILLIIVICPSAAAAEFTDVSDPETERALEVLQALGIVEGFPDGSYRPEQTLTRAQFCKLAVVLMGLEDQLLSAAQKTLFSDVTSAHWAASYINLVYGRSLIQGYGNGVFGPDDNITYEQAVTISLRILGYESSDIGNFYPDDYLRFADRLGLTASLDRIAGEALTRAEAAELLCSLLKCKTKNGSIYASRLASKTVSSVILLDNETVSPAGLLHAAKFYSAGQAVWYSLAVDLDASLIGTSGTVLLNEKDALIAFLPDTADYTVIDGILLANSVRTAGTAGSTYSVKLYTDDGAQFYPRANTISSNLVGCSGSLILNGNGYATAFISDDSAVYNLSSDALLVQVNTISDTGVSGCAEFLVNGKSVYYRKGFLLSSSLIGYSGTVLSDDEGNLVDFLPEDIKQELLIGICLGNTAEGVSFLINGTQTVYPAAVSITAAQIGCEGRILLNEQGYLSAFYADSSKKYSIISDAVLLKSQVLSDTSFTFGADFYVNGKSAWYAYGGSFTGGSAGRAGTLLLDSSSCIAAFLPTGENYYLLSGILTETNSSYNFRSVTLYTGGQTVTYPVVSEIPSGSIGSYGTLMLNAMGYAAAFIKDSNADYSLSQSGILFSVGDVADDGITRLARILVNNNTVTYAVSVSGILSENDVGRSGRLMLDQNGRAVSFIPESDRTSQTSTVISVSENTLITSLNTYTIRPQVTVITAERTVSNWEKSYSSLSAGSTVTLFFDALGTLTLIFIK